jgi:hypothetical protein
VIYTEECELCKVYRQTLDNSHFCV